MKNWYEYDLIEFSEPVVPTLDLEKFAGKITGEVPFTQQELGSPVTNIVNEAPKRLVAILVEDCNVSKVSSFEIVRLEDLLGLAASAGKSIANHLLMLLRDGVDISAVNYSFVGLYHGHKTTLKVVGSKLFLLKEKPPKRLVGKNWIVCYKDKEQK